LRTVAAADLFWNASRRFSRLNEWIMAWLATTRDRRNTSRLAIPGLSAHYWDGAFSKAHPVLDISASGAYLLTAKWWYPGTIIDLVLQQDPAEDDGHSAPAAVLHVSCRVVRFGADGIGVEFLCPHKAQRQGLQQFLASAMRNAMERGKAQSRGQSLVEFALILPLLFLLVVNVVNFGAFLFAWITIANAARSGSQYMAMGGATVLAPNPPTAAQVTGVVTRDVSSLLNRASLQVKVCTNNNGTVACTGSGGWATPADPEPSYYVLGTVDVTYTYKPPIPLWSFPNLGIYATLPATTIHRQAAMRMLQ
jgi:Flp pilus assembly protein TadG